MGVPRFFKWLAERYPCIITPCNAPTMPTIDNLYLDMNGIIHVCTHSNDTKVSAKESEKLQLQKIFAYIDKLFQMIKPTQYFFLAVDGVAPRAKMNQQRQRRFRSAFEAEQGKKELIKKGIEVPEETFDSNCITPGTTFMARLSHNLQYFIAHKIETDMGWRKCKIVYSGHDTPGEGEHKIMDFIRKRKMAPNYNPNEKHVLYGLDADLIMLGLASHEPHFMLLREDVFEQFNYRPGEEKNKPLQKNFQLLHLSTLRDYINLEMETLWKEKNKQGENFDLERVVDDFVFICFFCGNDFLPHSPTLDIGEGAVSLLFSIYQDILLEVGYLTEKTVINFNNVAIFCKRIAERDEELLLEKYQRMTTKKYGKNFKSSISRMKTYMIDEKKEKSIQKTQIRSEMVQYNATHNIFAEMNDELNIEEELQKQDELLKNDYINPLTSLGMSSFGEVEEIDLQGFEQVESKNGGELKFDFKGWRGAYYKEKMNIDYEDKNALQALIKSYIEGLIWIYQYYYRGCISWGWFYPYSYSPLVTDIAECDIVEIANSIQFELGEPFNPFQQLLGVLPPSSAHLLPPIYQSLMTSSTSPIADMFPPTFIIDREATRYDYEGVVVLPFMDENRLKEAEKTLDLSKLTKAEIKQNQRGESALFQYDEKGSFSISPLIDDMPTVVNSKISLTPYKDPEGPPYIPYLCEGVKLGNEGPEGFPSLRTLPVSGALRNIGITILGHPSKKDSLLLKLDNSIIEQYKTAEDLLHLLGKQVYIGYPLPQPAIVSSIADVDKSYYGSSSNVEQHDEDESEQFQREATHHRSVLYGRFGIDIGEVKVLVYCRLFKGMMKDNRGSTSRLFTDTSQEYPYPSQLILQNYNPIPDSRFKSRKFHLEDDFKVGADVICLTKEHYGSKGKVTKVVLPYSVEVDLDVQHSENIDYPIELTEGSRIRYYPLYVLCKMLKLPDGKNPSTKAIGMLTTDLKVSDNNNTYRVGLRMRHVSQGKVLLHYARCKLDSQKGDQSYFLNFGTGSQSGQGNKFAVGSVSNWEFSDKARDLLQEYIDRFPAVFFALEKLKGRLQTLSDLFYGQNVEDPTAMAASIDEWVKSLHLKEKLFVSATNSYLEKEHLKKVEDAILNYNENHSSKTTIVHVVLNPNQVYKPPDPVHGGMIDPDLLDIGTRVVYIRKEGQVPFGLRGVIVGIEGESAQVVFDQEFIGGSTFGETLRGNRGQIVPKLSLLNLDRLKPRKKSKHGQHFSSKEAAAFKEFTPYNSAHYYNVARKPPRGVIDISRIGVKAKQETNQKRQKKQEQVPRQQATQQYQHVMQSTQLIQPTQNVEPSPSVWGQSVESINSSNWNPAELFKREYSKNKASQPSQPIQREQTFGTGKKGQSKQQKRKKRKSGEKEHKAPQKANQTTESQSITEQTEEGIIFQIGDDIVQVKEAKKVSSSVESGELTASDLERQILGDQVTKIENPNVPQPPFPLSGAEFGVPPGFPMMMYPFLPFVPGYPPYMITPEMQQQMSGYQLPPIPQGVIPSEAPANPNNIVKEKKGNKKHRKQKENRKSGEGSEHKDQQRKSRPKREQHNRHKPKTTVQSKEDEKNNLPSMETEPQNKAQSQASLQPQAPTQPQVQPQQGSNTEQKKRRSRLVPSQAVKATTTLITNPNATTDGSSASIINDTTVNVAPNGDQHSNNAQPKQDGKKGKGKHRYRNTKKNHDTTKNPTTPPPIQA